MDKLSAAFEKWWDSDGRFIDPDTSDVPWFDKRKELCGFAFAAAAAEIERLELALLARASMQLAHDALLVKVERLEASLRSAMEIPPCTCGSGGHPRKCKQHPQGYELHVMTLDYENAKEELQASIAQVARMREALEWLRRFIVGAVLFKHYKDQDVLTNKIDAALSETSPKES